MRKKTIRGEYNREGYVIFLDDPQNNLPLTVIYRANKFAPSLRTMRKYCLATATELARSSGVRVGSIKRVGDSGD